jgi:hypothetical protein
VPKPNKKPVSKSTRAVSVETAHPAVETPLADIEPQVDVIKFAVGTQVFHRIKPSGEPGLVMGVVMCPGHYKYLVMWASAIKDVHYDFELCLEQPPLLPLRYNPFEDEFDEFDDLED